MKKILVWLLLLATGAAVQIVLPLIGYPLSTALTFVLWGGLFVIGIAATALMKASEHAPVSGEGKAQRMLYRKYMSLSSEDRKKEIIARLAKMGETQSSADALSVTLSKLLKGSMLSDLSYPEQRQIKNSANAIAFLKEVGIDITAKQKAKA